MTRKKVELTYITNDSKRKATFKKRKSGLIKKIDEISILCGVEACAVIYAQNDTQPDIWPSVAGAQRVLSKFKRMPELEQSKKMLNQESFLKQRIMKTQEQLKRQRNDNRKKEMTLLMFQYLGAGKVFDNVNAIDLNDLSWLIDQNLNEIERRIHGSQIQESTSQGEHGHMDDHHFINGGGYEMLPFGNVNGVGNCVWSNPNAS